MSRVASSTLRIIRIPISQSDLASPISQVPFPLRGEGLGQGGDTGTRALHPSPALPIKGREPATALAQVGTCLIRLLLLAALLATTTYTARAAEKKYWDLSPYRVHLHLCVEDAARPQAELSQELVSALQSRIRATLYPLWNTTITLETQVPQLSQLERLSPDALAMGCEKQMYLAVRATPLGYELACREFDCTTRQWGRVHHRPVRQAWMLPAQCFDLLCRTFAPLATVLTLTEDEDHVQLHFRGSSLPVQTNLDSLMPMGEAYLPLMARQSSAGEIKPETIAKIPWTYVTLTQHQDGQSLGEIHTGTRRPFGVRRRGRIEYFALAVREPVGATTVRFYPRHDAGQGLSGYEVFRREPTATESQALGLTDARGAVEITAGESPVTLLFLRSEGQLLAKVPVVPGAVANLEVPVADDPARLRAQAALTSLTEQLIDTVAQRNILIARARARIEAGQLDEAQDLMTELDELRGRAQFDDLLRSTEELPAHRSDDPRIQQRITNLFSETRKLLGRFLSTRQLTELQSELTAARRGESG